MRTKLEQIRDHIQQNTDFKMISETSLKTNYNNNKKNEVEEPDFQR